MIEEDKQIRDQFFEGWDKEIKVVEQKVNEKFDSEAIVILLNLTYDNTRLGKRWKNA